MANDLSSIRGILRNNRTRLHSRVNVVATGIGYKITGGVRTSTLSIICSVEQKVPVSQLTSQELVPEMVDGIPTDVLLTGRIRALASHTARARPAPGGISIGHKDITAGTLGCLVNKNGQIFILSNNHVLANSNAAQVGDPILQPGPYDGGRYPEDHIANLTQYIPISFREAPSDCSTASGIVSFLNAISRTLGRNVRFQTITSAVPENLVDAAIAGPIDLADVTEDIMEIGTIQGTGHGELGMAVKKSGRTTGFTTGEIEQVDVSANVQYGSNQTALFTDQLMAGGMSQGGDSGSAVLDENNNLVGLLFAGSDTTTIINRIENVFSALGISV